MKILMLTVFLLCSSDQTVQTLKILPAGGSLAYDMTQSDKKMIVFTCFGPDTVTAEDAMLEWYNGNDVQVTDSSGRVLVYAIDNSLVLMISQAVDSDAGTYTCKGNIEGVATKSSIKLELYKGITNTSPMKQYPVRGTDAKIMCNVSAGIGYSVKWFNGRFVPIKTDYRYIQMSDHLLVRNIQLNDSGSYVCQCSIATLGLTAAYNISVTVTIPPKMVRPIILEPPTQKEGDDLELICLAEGTPAPTYMYYKGDVLLSQEASTSGRYRLEKVTRDNEGNYSCVATNMGGEDRQTVKVDIRIPPKIEPINNVSMQAGRKCVLFCIAKGDPKPDLFWRRKDHSHFYSESPQDGETIYTEESVATEEESEFALITKTTLKLVIPNLRPEDNNEYVCKAQNEVGEEEKTGHIDVQYAPNFSNQADIGTIFYGWVGGFTNLTCIANGNPESVILWMYNGKDITAGPDYSIQEGENNNPTQAVSYLIPSVRSEDGVFGIYTCRAINKFKPVGEDQNLEFKLAIPPKMVGPIIQKPPTQKEGDDLELICLAEGTPPPTYTYYKGDVLLSQETSTSGRYRLEKVTRDNEGNYSCVATNMGGEDRQTVKVDIRIPPKIEPINNVSMQAGRKCELFCIAEGDPKPELVWRREDQNQFYSESPQGGETIYTEESVAIKEESEFTLITKTTLKLVIPNLRPEDSYEYVCKAQNEIGEEEKTGRVDVQFPLKIEPINNVSMHAGQKCELFCIAKGDPKPNLLWRRKDHSHFYSESPQDGETIYTEESVAIEEESEFALITKTILKLVIPNLRPEDSYEYVCKAQNEVGEEEKTGRVDVQYAPNFSNQADIGTVFYGWVGGFTNLTCIANGNPEPVIMWMYNGKDITAGPDYSIQQGENNNRTQAISYLIPSVRSETGVFGMYTCRAINKFKPGGEDQTLEFKLAIPPKMVGPIIQEPPTQKEGDDLELICLAEGTPPPTYIYYKGEVLLSQEASTSGRYRLVNVTRDNEGNYSCVATNVGGKDRQTVKVDIRIPPKIEPINNVSMEAGRKCELLCIAKGDPKPHVFWRREDHSHFYSESPQDGETIYTEESFVIEEESEFTLITKTTLKLVIPNPQPEDSYKYVCKAQNEVGQEEKNGRLDVQYAPNFSNQADIGTAFYGWVGGFTNLTCIANGNPEPVIRWMYNGKDITAGPDYSIQQGENNNPTQVVSYLIPSVRSEDGLFGMYTCRAINKFKPGGEDQNLEFKLAIPPKMVGPITQQPPTPKEGDDLELICLAEGTPVPTYMYYKGDVLLSQEASTSGRYRLEKVTRDNEGNYSCVATNMGGEDRQTVKVDIRIPPTIEPINNVSMQADRKCELFCIAKGDPKPNLFWRRKDHSHLYSESPQDGETIYTEESVAIEEESEFTLITKTTLKLVIPNLRPEDSYEYVCKAQNEVGEEEKTGRVDVQFPPTIEPINNVSMQAGQKCELFCIAKGGPKPNLLWRRKDHSHFYSESPQDGETIYTEESFAIEEEFALITKTTLKLVIPNLRPEDSYEYVCKAQNKVGEEEKTGRVDVQYAPNFSNQADIGTVFYGWVGGFTNLTCIANGNPEPVILWMYNGMDIMAGPDYSTQLGENNNPTQAVSYLIPSVRSEAGVFGMYTCRAINKFKPGGEDQTLEFKLASHQESSSHGAVTESIVGPVIGGIAAILLIAIAVIAVYVIKKHMNPRHERPPPRREDEHLPTGVQVLLPAPEPQPVARSTEPAQGDENVTSSDEDFEGNCSEIPDRLV